MGSSVSSNILSSRISIFHSHGFVILPCAVLLRSLCVYSFTYAMIVCLVDYAFIALCHGWIKALASPSLSLSQPSEND